MKNTSYKVNIWNIKTRKNAKGKVTSYGVRWAVDGQPFYESYKVRAQADSRRAELVSAQRRGEPFDRESGLPASLSQEREEVSWYDFTCGYVDAKWPKAAATYRRTIAEALAAATPVMLRSGNTAPDAKVLRSVLKSWVFNSAARVRDDKPAEVASVLNWIERNSLPVSAVTTKQGKARALHEAVVSRVDGAPLARSVARQRRMILNNALNHAVETGVLAENPVPSIKWTAPKPSRAIDSRRVANPVQARTILLSVKDVKRSGPRLYACYAAMYFAALRPEEAIDLREYHLTLPHPGWNEETEEWVYDSGKIYVEDAAPHAGKAWTDSGQARDQRGLKHREPGEGRHVPCPPELTAILRQHICQFGTDDHGRLFRGIRGGEVPLITWNRVWKAARAATLTERVAATPLASRPYDLRHAAVSTWLNGGVPPTVVAEWAGHSVEVLLQVYAKCLDGQDHLAMQQVQAALGHKP
ncbi:MAG: hypothetical protein GEU86_12865 [Actinophytocola sp.]|nr:hypothetical protein [Actinophytocola sp.]